MTDWQPIETAPKDGTVILLYAKEDWVTPLSGNKIVTGKWIEGPWQNVGKNVFIFGSHYYMDKNERKQVMHVVDAAYWMPLPPPPKKENE